MPAAISRADVVINPKKSLLTIDFAAVVNEVRRAFVVIEGKLAGKAGIEPEAAPRTRRSSEAESRKPKSDSMRQFAKLVALQLLRAYKWAISPLFPPACRYVPTCSEYAHGSRRTLWRAARRLDGGDAAAALPSL